MPLKVRPPDHAFCEPELGEEPVSLAPRRSAGRGDVPAASGRLTRPDTGVCRGGMHGTRQKVLRTRCVSGSGSRLTLLKSRARPVGRGTQEQGDVWVSGSASLCQWARRPGVRERFAAWPGGLLGRGSEAAARVPLDTHPAPLRMRAWRSLAKPKVRNPSKDLC